MQPKDQQEENVQIQDSIPQSNKPLQPTRKDREFDMVTINYQFMEMRKEKKKRDEKLK